MRHAATGTATVAALPFAVAGTALLARVLPVRFEYVENPYGIVSLVTEQRYPMQQETFWWVCGTVVGSLLAWALARGLRGVPTPGRAIALEALAAGALVALLFLPASAAALAVPLALACALWLAPGAGSEAPLAPHAGEPGRAWASRLWLVPAVLVAPLLTPGLPIHLWDVANGVADTRLAQDHFKFLGETGQHLAWADALRSGGFKGRDFFSLYGPLYDRGLALFWDLVGRSVAAWHLYWSLTRVLGWVSLFLLGAALVQRRVLVLLLPLFLPWVELRVGFALFALLFVHAWLASGRRGWCAAAGVAAGTGLFYSQEFGAACALASAFAFAVRRDLRAAALFAVGGAAVGVPLLGWYAAHGALVPMLRDLVEYPRYMMAGYGKLPFAPLFEVLPLTLAYLGRKVSLEVRLGYLVPAVCVGGVLLALPISRLDPRRPLASLRGLLEDLARDPVRLTIVLVALFGLVSFRSALGRSSLHRVHGVLPAAALLLVAGCDRIATLWSAGRPLRALAVWRTAAFALLFFFAGFPQDSRPWANVAQSLRTAVLLRERGHHPIGDPRILVTLRWIEEHTEPGEPILFLPNDGAYYYLTGRPPPIRFVMGHQIVSQSHRDEVLRDLRASPPRFVVWDHDALRVDDLPDEKVFGKAIMDWLEASYETHERLGTMEILRHRNEREARSGPGR